MARHTWVRGEEALVHPINVRLLLTSQDCAPHSLLHLITTLAMVHYYTHTYFKKSKLPYNP